MSRISYRNFPILKTIMDGNMDCIKHFPEDYEELKKVKVELIEMFNKACPAFSKNICKVSSNFYETAMTCRDKLMDVITKDVESGSGFDFAGTIISNNFLYCYDITSSNGEISVIIYEVYKDGGVRNVIAHNGVFFRSKVDNEIAVGLKDDFGYFLSLMILTILYFKKYAKVEIVESKAKSKVNQFGTKYLNETDFDIEYLDSKWFTTLVRSEGFKVRGFFRLQPKKKDGQWTKELIWIDEFEKHGYHRQAKIETNINTD